MTRWSLRCDVALLTLLVLCVPLPVRAQARDEPLPPNPFADVTSFMLPNGLRVWYRHLPGAGTASVTLTVPHGAGDDLPGLEGTAHLLEHALFSDRDGRTESEIVREVQDRGGVFNASTSFDRTAYYLTIGGDNTAFAIRWLHGVLAPREFTATGVARSREPVAIETRVKPRSVVDRAVALATHPSLRPAGFWMREFGLTTADARDVDAHAALHAITPADLQHFYDTYYVPTRMTLLVVSDVPLAHVQGVLTETFGTLPWRPEPAAPPATAPRTGATSRHFWNEVAATEFALRYRVRNLDAADHQRLIFLGDLLRRRLFERLRLTAEPAVYSVSANTVMLRDAAFFGITAAIMPEREEAARAIILEELDRLRTLPDDSAAFYRDRDAVARQLRLQNGTPAALQQWLLHSFHQPSVHAVLPDLGEYYATVGPDSLAAFAQRLFTEDNRILSVTRPLPLSTPVLAGLLALVLAAAVRLYRHRAAVPADMSRVRFVGRIRRRPAARIAGFMLAAGGTAVGLRLIVAAAHHASDRWLLRLDGFLYQYTPLAVLLFLTALAALHILGLIPARVLVFDDHVRLKSRTYASRLIPGNLISTVRLARRGEVGGAAGALTGPSRGVLIGLADGRSRFIGVRDPEALVRSLIPLTEAATEPSAPAATADLPA
jgi:predicted Zn-dependent peptidase